jgi:phosphoribosylformylglycinamidine (FGAM) synthase-like amidotransferase family enzyme
MEKSMEKRVPETRPSSFIFAAVCGGMSAADASRFGAVKKRLAPSR